MGPALREVLSVLIGGWQLEREGLGGVGGPQGPTCGPKMEGSQEFWNLVKGRWPPLCPPARSAAPSSARSQSSQTCCTLAARCRR